MEAELARLRARVAELEAAERARDRMHTLHRALVEGAAIGLGMSDDQGEFVIWNDAMMAVSGYAPSDLEGWRRVRQTEAARESRKRLLEVVLREGLLAHEVRTTRADGTPGEALVTAQPTRLDGTVYVHVTMQDVTELRRVEHALRESELRFRQVAETIRQVFYITNADFSQVLYVSPAYEEIWERPCASLYEEARGWIDAIHPEDRARITERLALGPIDGEYVMEYRIVQSDGSVRWILDRAIVLGGGTDRLVGAAEDITDRRRLEEQLRESQKMEALGQLAGGVAHDFNNVLTTILCNVALLTKHTEAAVARERLDEVKLAADRAAGLTKKLLGFSRSSVLSLETVDLRATLRETATLLRHTLDPRVRLVVDESEEPATVLADAGQMVQVALNLCLNGRDAMPEGGTLTLRTRRCEVKEAQARLTVDARAGEAVCLSVVDTGHGMAPETRGRVFEPFFTTKEPGAGTGLGLAMVFGIVKQHGGWLEFCTEVGRGTRFDVYLPFHDRPVAESVLPVALPRSAARETVLFVDDEAPLRKIADAVLSDRGYRVILAEDGAAALEIFEREWRSIALVVLDLRMPHLSGRDTLRAMRRIHPGLRVLVSSGHAGDHERIAQAERIAGSLHKPYEIEDLANAVRAALAG